MAAVLCEPAAHDDVAATRRLVTAGGDVARAIVVGIRRGRRGARRPRRIVAFATTTSWRAPRLRPSSGGRSARGPRASRTRRRPCPRALPMLIVTRVSRWSPSSSSSSSRPGGRSPLRRRLRLGAGVAAVGGVEGGASCSRIASSTARTERSSSTMRRASCSWNARSGVAEQGPRLTHVQPALVHELLDRRRELEEAQRVGDAGAALAHLRRHRLVGEPEVLDELLVRGGFLERVEVVAVQVLDERVLRPTWRRRSRARAPGSSAARRAAPPASGARRRSARSRRRPGRTRIGWSTPTSRIESASAPSASSSKWSRGWNRFGLIADVGSSSRPPPVSVSESRLVPGGMSAPSPLPSPPRRATTHLFRQLPVRRRAARRGIEHDDRLPERRRLGETHRPRDHRLVHPGTEVLAHLAARPARRAWSASRAW